MFWCFYTAVNLQDYQNVDPNNSRRYYNNYNWQVLAEYNGSDAFQRWFAYGNSIDEVLFMHIEDGNEFFYAHDHLGSPAAMLFSGLVAERYEYDAYGNCYIMDSSYGSRSASLYNNPYYFTGRGWDFLDGGSLKTQYSRGRYYDYYTGRMFQHDPLGINPAGGTLNPFDIHKQYTDGMSLYEYAKSRPIDNLDSWGLKCGVSGPDITNQLLQLKDKVADVYDNNWTDQEKKTHCSNLYSLYSGVAWEITELHTQAVQAPSGSGCGCGDCGNTVTVNGHAYSVHEVNYWMWGVANKLCGNSLSTTVAVASGWATFGAPTMAYCGGYPCVGSSSSKTNWAKAGWYGNFSALNPSSSQFNYCKPCATNWTGTLTPSWL